MPAVVAVTDKELSDFRVPGGGPGLSAREMFDLDGQYEAVQVYKCDWADRYTVIVQAATAVYPHNTTGEAWLSHARIVGAGQSSVSDGLITYPLAVVYLYFDTRAPRKVGSSWVTEEITEFSYTVPIAPQSLYWEDDDNPGEPGAIIGERVPLHKSIGGLIYHVRYWHVASVPGTVLTLKDGCNNAVFNTLTFGLSFPAEHVWYKTPHIRKTTALGGSPDFMVGLVFAYRPASWNKQWNALADNGDGTIGAWRYVYDADGNQVVFHVPVNLTLY